MSSTLGCEIRWLIRRDMNEVMAIEQASFQDPWTEDEFLQVLRQRNCIGIVAELDRVIHGYAIYELNEHDFNFLNFAVAESSRRSGVGRALIQRMKDKLSQQGRRELVASVRETNLEGQLFLQAMGFRAEAVLRDYYGEEFGFEDAYSMRYEIDGSERFIPKNRLKWV